MTYTNFTVTTERFLGIIPLRNIAFHRPEVKEQEGLCHTDALATRTSHGFETARRFHQDLALQCEAATTARNPSFEFPSWEEYKGAYGTH